MSALEAFIRRVAAHSVVVSEGESQLAVKLRETLKGYLTRQVRSMASRPLRPADSGSLRQRQHAIVPEAQPHVRRERLKDAPAS